MHGLALYFHDYNCQFSKVLLYYFDLMLFLICCYYQSLAIKTNGINIYCVYLAVISCLSLYVMHCVYSANVGPAHHFEVICFPTYPTYLAICWMLLTWVAKTTVTAFVHYQCWFFGKLVLLLPHSPLLHCIKVLYLS